MQTMNTAPARNTAHAAGIPGKAPRAPASRVPTGKAPKGYSLPVAPAAPRMPTNAPMPHGGPLHNGLV